MKSLRIVLVTAAVTTAVGCVTEDSLPSSKITLDGETRTATALAFDVLDPAAVTIVLAHQVERGEQCGWIGYDSVEMRLLIGDRSTPHVIDPLDVTTPFTGGVDYIDGDLNYVPAVRGTVTPALTDWAFSEAEGHNVIVQIDGELDVELADGRQLSGAFSATPCQ